MVLKAHARSQIPHKSISAAAIATRFERTSTTAGGRTRRDASMTPGSGLLHHHDSHPTLQYDCSESTSPTPTLSKHGIELPTRGFAAGAANPRLRRRLPGRRRHVRKIRHPTELRATPDLARRLELCALADGADPQPVRRRVIHRGGRV